MNDYVSDAMTVIITLTLITTMTVTLLWLWAWQRLWRFLWSALWNVNCLLAWLVANQLKLLSCSAAELSTELNHCEWRTWICEVWWLTCRFGALRPEGRRLESHSSHHVGTLGKSFAYNCLLCFGVLTPTQYQLCCQEHLWVVMDLKRRYRNIGNESRSLHFCHHKEEI